MQLKAVDEFARDEWRASGGENERQPQIVSLACSHVFPALLRALRDPKRVLSAACLRCDALESRDSGPIVLEPEQYEPDLIEVVNGDSDLACEIAREPVLTLALAASPALATAIDNEPGFPRQLPAIARELALTRALSRAIDRELNFENLHLPTHLPNAVKDEDTVLRTFSDFIQSNQSIVEQRNEVTVPPTINARNYDVLDRELEEALHIPPALPDALSEPNAVEVVVLEPGLRLALRREPHLVGVLENRALAEVIIRCPDLTNYLVSTLVGTPKAAQLADTIVREAELVKALSREHFLVQSIFCDPSFAGALVRDPTFLFGADYTNRCIKRLHRREPVYRLPEQPLTRTRVHNVLFPDNNDSSDLFAIESVFDANRNKSTLFRLVRLTYNNENGTWKNTWESELGWTNIENHEVRVPHTSLCRAKSHLLCATPLSYCLKGFKYNGKSEAPNIADDEEFDLEIVHVDTHNTDTRSLIAIAFANESICLYRTEELSDSNTRSYVLQETYRVAWEHVYSLLFVGDRLLVAERTADGEMHNITSCEVIEERLEDETLLSTQIPIECWCFDPGHNHIYCVTSDSFETLKLEIIIVPQDQLPPAASTI